MQLFGIQQVVDKDQKVVCFHRTVHRCNTVTNISRGVVLRHVGGKICFHRGQLLPQQGGIAIIDDGKFVTAPAAYGILPAAK